ncbi:helix-turn-helix domain-containing protein [Dechloromonas sp. ARDL1]|uniref:helix-turn-helix domain-containing protein n=1 Tax=Dechloromonas sp. ARDL1 TaxID=3322121 RepID=UPI003DA748CE
MPTSLHSPQYEIFRRLIVQARRDAGLTQTEVALRLRKPQSFISKLERGERRIDVPEFVEIAEAMGIDAAMFINTYTQEKNDRQTRLP